MITYICPECGQEFRQSKGLTEKKIFCGVACANKHIARNPVRNKKIGRTLRKQYMTGERVGWSAGETKYTHPILAKMAASKVGSIPWNKGNILSEKERKTCSDRIARLYIEGRIHGRGYYVYSNKNRSKIFCRSSYEVIALRHLESDPTVQEYKYEPFRIPYITSVGTSRYTIPDFLVFCVNGSRMLVEVKPTFKLEWKTEQLKIDAMRQYAQNNDMAFSIWTETELGLN